jgi:hypothetical protein
MEITLKIFSGLNKLKPLHYEMHAYTIFSRRLFLLWHFAGRLPVRLVIRLHRITKQGTAREARFSES